MRRIAFLLAFAAGAAPAVAQPPAAPAATRWGLSAQDLSILTGDRLLAKAGLPGRLAELRAAAEANDSLATTLLAIAHLNGIGVAADPAEGRRLAERAAAMGEARALYALGAIRARGNGIPVDYAGAASFFERAHAAGIMLAAADLGSLLYNGDGVARDRARAFALMRDAAAAGVVHVHGGLALAYFNGDGTAQDYAAAREAAWRGVEHRDPTAQMVLSVLTGNGFGMERDGDRALGWLQTAALDGSLEALQRLEWSAETLALVRRWGPYARLTHRRLNSGPHIFHYRWQEPGRVLVLDYENLEDRGAIDVVFTWPEGAAAPVSDHPDWSMRIVDGQFYERAPLGMFLQFNVDLPQASITVYGTTAEGGVGPFRRSDPLRTLPPSQYEELRAAALARPEAPVTR